MILLILFLSFWLGLSIRHIVIPLIILGIIFLIFIFIRFGRKLFFFALLFIASGVGSSFINITHTNNSFNALIVEIHENYYIADYWGEKLYIYEKDNDKEIGDVVSINGYRKDLSFQTIESGFDFQKYLSNKGIDNQFIITSEKRVFQMPLRTKTLKGKFLSKFDDRTASFLKAVLFSENEDGEVNELVNDFHLSRFLSSGGVYLHTFLSFIEAILLMKCKPKTAKIVTLAILFPYLLFIFPRFAALKMVLMSVLRFINEYPLKKKFSYFNILAISGFIFLVIDFHFAYTTGFILGYILPILFIYSSRLFKKKKKWKRKILTSFITYLFFIPFEISFYNSVSLFTFPLQIVFTPIFIFVAVVGFLCFFHIPLFVVANKTTYLLEKILSFIKPLSFDIHISPFNVTLTIIYILFFFVFLYYLNKKFKPVLKYFYIGIISFSVFYILPIENMVTSEVTFINVGQGDSCLIRDRNKTILIDTGGSLYNDIASDCLIPYFKKKRIYQIDLLITTHDDYDHSGAYSELKESFKIKRYISESTYFPIKIDDIILYNYNNHTSEDDNNLSSLVIGFSLSNINYLIMGDAPIEIEKEIMNKYTSIPCDVLKVGHHGSDTSTSSAFLDYLSPKEAIISVGRNNYGHPHKSVLNLLKEKNIKIRRTDEEGSITYKKKQI